MAPFFDWDRPVGDDERDGILNKVAQQVVRRGLATPAVWMLEIHRPIMPLAGQMGIVFSPLLGTLFSGGAFDLQRYIKLMQRRENVDRLVALIEEKEKEERVDGERRQAEA